MIDRYSTNLEAAAYHAQDDGEPAEWPDAADVAERNDRACAESGIVALTDFLYNIGVSADPRPF